MKQEIVIQVPVSHAIAGTGLKCRYYPKAKKIGIRDIMHIYDILILKNN
ncbi:MAG: hypothetical protein H0U49_04555 [Parachlamydiaceae bacterium]|nr:hypothetical protein [Parachlamydiaceae bacterium]